MEFINLQNGIFELRSLSCWLIVGFRYALVLEFTLCNSKLNWTISLLSWKLVLLWKCFQGAHECEQKTSKAHYKDFTKGHSIYKKSCTRIWNKKEFTATIRERVWSVEVWAFFILFFNVLDKIVKGWRWRRWQGKVVEEEEEEAIK